MQETTRQKAMRVLRQELGEEADRFALVDFAPDGIYAARMSIGFWVNLQALMSASDDPREAVRVAVDKLFPELGEDQRRQFEMFAGMLAPFLG